MKRHVYFISDGTGITTETLGNALLAQFDEVSFIKKTIPYVDSVEKAEKAVKDINRVAEESGCKAIIFDTIIDKEIHAAFDQVDAFQIDIFEAFLSPLEQELNSDSSYSMGKSHSSTTSSTYLNRIAAVNFALDNDDGARTRQYDEADVILIGVSRSGKTPTSLYLAMQFGIKAANYPLTEEDMQELTIPKFLKQYKKKLFGLTIDPERLATIREERKANSKYASLNQCYFEVEEVESLYQMENIPYISTTNKSIEEISTRILQSTGLKRILKF